MLSLAFKKLNTHRRAAVAILCAMTVINIFIVSSISHYGLILDIPDFFSGTFEKRISLLFQKVRTETDRFWLAHVDLQHIDATVPVKHIVPDTKDRVETELWQDQRFTLAVYLNELLLNAGSEETPVLPFHWADWIDLSEMNKYLTDSDSRKMSCSKLKMKVRNRPDVSYFCTDKSSMSQEDIEKMGWSSPSQLPEGIVHNHCRHDHNTINDYRSFMAKSYIMTHLGKPLKVIILNKQLGTYEFYVNQKNDPQQRLRNSGMVDRFLQLYLGKSTEDAEKAGENIPVNHMILYKKLLAKRKPQQLSESDDPYGVYKNVHGNKTDLPLSADVFHYDRGSLPSQIEMFEKRQNLTVMEENYLAGLRQCEPYNDETELTYFREPTLDIKESKNVDNDWGWHYDWRFFTDALMYEKEGWTREERVVRTNIILERLLRNWSRFVEEKGLVSWIEHGPLLSWYWDGLMFPYDNDIDVQMPVQELLRLARDYNQTLVLEDPTEGYGKFLIDIGTYVHNRGISQKENHIDGRFIDVDSGLYIDITGLAQSNAKLPKEYEENPIVEKLEGDNTAEVYNDRRKHFYTLNQLQPLHYSMLSGVPVFIPQQIEKRLVFAYSKGLDDYEYNGWLFVPSINLWVRKNKVTDVLDKNEYMMNNKENRDLLIEATKNLDEEQTYEILSNDDDILIEYYLTHDVTEFHMEEMNFLFDRSGRDSTKLAVPSVRRRYQTLTKTIQMQSPMRKCLFEYERFDRLKHH